MTYSSLKSIVFSTDDLSRQANLIAAGTEEMSGTIAEIAGNCQKESEISSKASAEARTASSIMEKLGESANQIGRVITIIDNIAAKTKLLALNASIEAASAGAAGKGFAVVAAEVKELAGQTASATHEIQEQVETMQTTSTEAVVSMGTIVDVIRELSTVSQTIASSVVQQSTTTAEVAESVAQVSKSADIVAVNARESSEALSEVNTTLQQVGDAAASTTEHIIRLDQDVQRLHQSVTAVD